MSGLEIQSTGEMLATYNGNVVENAKWNMDYDGENMEIATLRNNELTVLQLSNGDLHRLFNNINQHPKSSLEERLQRDYKKMNSINNSKKSPIKSVIKSVKSSGIKKTRRSKSPSSKRRTKKRSYKKSQKKDDINKTIY